MKLWTREYGDNLLVGKKPTVFFFHGLFGDGGNLKQLTELLAKQYYCVAVDFRNHGRSSHADSMSLQDIAQDVIELPIFQQSEQVIFIGHSLGGKIAMLLANQFPKKVCTSVIIDIAPVSYPSYHGTILKGLKAVALSRYKTRQDAARLLSEYVEDNDVGAFLLKSLRRNDEGFYEWRFNLSVIEKSYDGIREAINVYSLKPILFIKGELSNYIDDPAIKTIYQCFPNASIETIAGAGHWPHIVAPEQISSLVDSFLKKLP